MLVLSRKKDEAIVVGDNIRIIVVEIRGDKVRLGIEAPKHIAVDRPEIRQSKQRTDEILRRMAAGEPLYDIEAEFDCRDNQNKPQ